MKAQKIWGQQVYTAEGWHHHTLVTLNAEGKIATVTPCKMPPQDAIKCGILLPAPTNLHSHSFQRALAGQTEKKSEENFWSWRQMMYYFLEHLTPDEMTAITALAQMEMLEAGYACVCEFHYVHHQMNGIPYDDLGEMTYRLWDAQKQTGIGLTTLPVLYQQGSPNHKELNAHQKRFYTTDHCYQQLLETLSHAHKTMPQDCTLGRAAHSLRAVSLQALQICRDPQKLFHIHIAEQEKEVEEIKHYYGKRPLTLFDDTCGLSPNDCFIHATHMDDAEVALLASSGAVAGLCPVTEANLGDGLFRAEKYIQQHGKFGIGTDSNICISINEELQLLEYGQRLLHKKRHVFGADGESTGRYLYTQTLKGGAQAAGRFSGKIAVGYWGDLLSLDCHAPSFANKKEDDLLDSWIFSTMKAVSDVWSAGRHLVENGQHKKRDVILKNYHDTMTKIKNR